MSASADFFVKLCASTKTPFAFSIIPGASVSFWVVFLLSFFRFRFYCILLFAVEHRIGRSIGAYDSPIVWTR